MSNEAPVLFALNMIEKNPWREHELKFYVNDRVLYLSASNYSGDSCTFKIDIDYLRGIKEITGSTIKYLEKTGCLNEQ